MKKITALATFASVIMAVPACAGNWNSDVAKIIANHQVYPRSAELRREQGTTRLRVGLAADGHIGQIDVVESSGSAILDLGARSTMSGIGKLPPPPPGITNLVVPIVWRLE